MNRLERVFTGSAFAVSSFAMSGAIVDAQGPTTVPIDQMSEADRDKAVRSGKITCSIAPVVLDMYGSDVTYSEVVVEVQEALIEQGFPGGGTDGKLGPRTCEKVLDFQDKSGKYVDGIVGKSTATAMKLTPEVDSKVATESKYEIDDCSGYKDWSDPTIRLVQKALGVRVDGDFGDASCNALIKFQKAKGLDKFGQGALGYRTMTALGIFFPEKKNVGTASNGFAPKEDCPKPTSCDALFDLNKQKLQIKNNAGEVLWETSIQSGKKGSETKTIIYKLGPVEYGLNGNPERPSTLYPEATLVNARSFGQIYQRIHGSYSFNPNAVNNPKAGSAGCIRLSVVDSYVFADMPTGTDVKVFGAKPGTTKK